MESGACLGRVPSELHVVPVFLLPLHSSLYPPIPTHLHRCMQGACLFYREWSRPLNTLAGDPQEERKLMFGMLYSIKGLVAALGSKVRVRLFAFACFWVSVGRWGMVCLWLICLTYRLMREGGDALVGTEQWGETRCLTVDRAYNRVA